MISNRRKKIWAVKIRRILKKISNHFNAINDSDIDDIQKQGISIIRRMMCKSDSTLLIAPISSICYIEWKHYFVKFSDNSATITNGKFSYYIWLPSLVSEQLRQQFYKNVELRRRKLETNYDKKTLESLKEINSQLDGLI